MKECAKSGNPVFFYGGNPNALYGFFPLTAPAMIAGGNYPFVLSPFFFSEMA
jgi:hypothetical protein